MPKSLNAESNAAKLFLAAASVTRWLDYFFSFWVVTTMKVCHFDEMFAKVGFQFCKIPNKPAKEF